MKLRIENLSVGYDTGVVLKDLSLCVEEGEFLSLLGPSGCGKTTLMKSIAGILPAERGSMVLDGTDITAKPIHKRGTVIVFQDMRLFPHRTVAENVAFPLKMQGIPKKQRLARAEALLDKVRMAGYGSRRPGELSGGQQQRVALARALAAQPRLLLLDEPFSALDENLREEMRGLVKELQKEFSMTVILVTHDRAEALSMSDRVALMFDGTIAQIGTPRQVYERPVSRRTADYFGDCVYIRGHVREGIFSGGGISCPAAVSDGAWDLLLRPAALEPDRPGNYPVTVTGVTFRGSDTQVAFAASDGTVWKKAFPNAVPWKHGDRLNAAVSTEDAVFFSV